MKVVYVSSLGLTGPSVHMIDLAVEVAELGHEVKVVVGAEEVCSVASTRGLATHLIPLRHKLDISGARRAAVSFEGADVVHTHDRRAGLLARMPARYRSVTTVHTFHGLPDDIAIEVGRDSPPARPPDVSVLTNLWSRHVILRAEALLARAGGLVVPSHALRSWLVRHGFSEKRMRVIPYGVPQLPLTDVPAHEPVRIATAAYIDHRKGIDVLVEACSKVSSAIRLDVYGDGPDRLDLEARSKALGLHAVWHGFVPDFRARRSDYDIFVLPTRGDNLPVAILEAMAAAAPVIATRVGGIPEEVIEGKTGLLVPPDDALALAEAIDQLTSHPDLRREMGTAGRELIGTVFHPARIAREMVKFYEQQLALDKAV